MSKVRMFMNFVGIQQKIGLAKDAAVPHDDLNHISDIAVLVLVLLDTHLMDHFAVTSHGSQSINFVAEAAFVLTAVLHVVAEHLGPAESGLVVRGLSAKYRRRRRVHERPHVRLSILRRF